LSDDPYFHYTRDDVEWLADQLADVLVAETRQQRQQYTVITIDMVELLDLKAIASGVFGITDPIGQLKDWLKKILEGFVQTIVDKIGSLISGVFNEVIKPILDRISSAISALADTVNKVVIQPIKDVLNWIAENIPKLKDTVTGLIDSIKNGLNTLSNTLVNITSQILSLVNSISSAVGDVISEITSKIQEIVKSVSEGIQSAVSAVQDALSAVQNAISGIVDQISSTLSNLASRIGDVISNVVSTITSLVEKIGGQLSDIVSSIAGKLSDLLGRAAGTIQDLLSRVGSAVSKIGDAISSVINAISSRLQNLANSVAQAISKLPSLISEALGRLSSLASKVASSISGLLHKAASTIQDIVSRIGSAVGKIIGEITSALRRLGEKLGELARGVIDVLTKVPGIISNIISKISSGLQDIAGRISKALSGLIEGAGKAIEGIIGRISKIVDKIVGTITSALERAGQTIRKMVENAVAAIEKLPDTIGRIVSRIGEGLSSLLQRASDLISKIIGGLQRGIGQILSGVRKIVDSIVSAAKSGIDKLVDLLGKARDVVGKIVDKVKSLPDVIEEALGKVKDFLSDVADKFKDVLETLGKMLSPAHVAVVVSDLLRRAAPDVYNELRSTLARIRNPLDFIANFPKLMFLSMVGLAKVVWYLMPKEVKDFFNNVANAVKTVGEHLMGFVNAIMKFPEWFPNWFKQHIAEPIVGALKRIGEWIWEHLPDFVKDFFSKAVDFFKSIPDYIKEAADKIREAGEKIVEAAKAVGEGLKKFFEDPLGTLKSVLEWLWEHALKPLGEHIYEGLKALGEWIWEHLPDAVKEFLEKARDALVALKDAIVGFFKDPVGTLKGVLQWLWDNAFKPLGERIYEGLKGLGQWIWEHLPEPVREFLEKARDALITIGEKVKSGVEWLIEHLPAVKDALIAVKDAIVAFFKDPVGTLKSLLEWLWDNVFKPLGERIYEGLKSLGGWIWEHLPDPVREALLKVRDFFGWLYEQLVEFFKDPKGKILDFLRWLWDKLLLAKDWIVDHVVKPLIDILKTIWDYVKKAVIWIAEHVFDALVEFGRFVLTGAYKIITGLADILWNIGKTLAGAFLNFAARVEGFIAEHLPGGIYKRHLEVLEEALGKDAAKAVAAVTAPFAVPLSLVGGFYKIIYEKAKDMMPVIMRDPVGTIYGIANLAIFGAVMGIILESAISSLARIFKGIEVSLSALLRPLGIGTKGEGKVKIDVGEALEKLSKSIGKIMPDVARYLIIGHMIWWAEPTRAITRYWLTNYITIELPPMEQTLRSLRRHLATPEAQTYYRIYVDQLRMGGISQQFIDYLYPLPDKLLSIYQEVAAKYDANLKALIITDRFGQPRVFPASLVAEIPTPSELAHMMIRDIILNPRDFAAVMSMHGFTPDVAFMFYLLHFRYPSPEKLAEFFWRGVAGELWNPDESYDKDIVATFFKKGEVPKPKAPKKFNFDAKSLFEMMKQYMKWHDYARIPWHKGWPTDNAIIMELIADIPGKIDLRWMTRWGLFDYWGAWGYGIKSSIEEITTGLLKEGQTTSAAAIVEKYLNSLKSGKIEFDVRQFARTLQATGLHPYWVPWISIAETINALSEERTLLRTGFINLFREGLWTLDQLNVLLSGFFTVVFKTGYFDPNTMDWKEVNVEFPVAFLPAESKLLELRAVMDKALDIYREAYRYLIRSALYYTVTVEEAEEILRDIVGAINANFFVSEIRKITGKSLGLELDKGYWAAWRRYVELLQDVEARLRTRYYARYIIWSVLWGLRWGYTTISEAEKWVEQMVNVMHEHKYVEDMIRMSVDFMIQRFYKEISVRAIVNRLRSRRITVDEALEEFKKLGFDEKTARLYIDANVIWYTPSITTYASMLEVVPEALDTVLNVVARFNLPEDERLYWMLYLARQPVRDELTLVRTRIYQLLALGMSPEELTALLSEYAVGYVYKDGKLELVAGPKAKEALAVYDKAVEVFQAFGISQHEWVLYNLIARMENLKDIMKAAEKERIPSPTTMASLAEYLVLPEDLVRKTLEEYHVAPEWLPYWLEYIRVKPLKSDYKSLLSVYIRALRYKAVSEDEFKKFLKELSEWGFTPKEVELVSRRAALEEAIVEAREAARLYIPTPTMLATLAEYMVLPSDLIAKALAARHVPEEWTKIWLEYIRVRPVKSDYKTLLTAYIRALRYGVVSRNDVEAFIKELSQWGFTPKEIEIIRRRVELEEAIAAAREYIPTPSMLATMAEYVPAVRRYALQVLEKRRVPREWWPVWLEYIHVRPLASEVREVVRDIRQLYEYFAIKLDDLKRLLKRFVQYGLEDEEIALLVYGSQLRAALRAYRELVGTPRQLVTMAEYSPKARRLALAQVYKMIDALPVDQPTKEFLKKMWEEYIRVRPVYDEVRRYITELISDYAEGVIGDDELKQELEALKDWGLDDYEIQFYMWLAQRRRVRYVYRELRRQQYFGL